MEPEPTPWRAMLSCALQFGVAPAAFWRLSMKEWRALVQPAALTTLTRAAFDDLARRFPDGGHDDRI